MRRGSQSIRMLTTRSQERRRRQRAALPSRVAQYFNQYGKTAVLSSGKTDRTKPKSFGVYLGQLSNPVTVDQARVLSQWDLIILDPLQPGVLDAVSTSRCQTDHILARLDLGKIAQGQMKAGDDGSLLRTLDVVTTTALEWQKRSQIGDSGFTGILLAQWDTTFTVAVCNKVLEFLAGLGYEVYLELSDPNFLGEDRTLRLDILSGLVVRNGSVLTTGERRDYFKMANMRTTIQAMVGQACLREFSTMVWDAVDAEVELSHAVVRRTYSWCSFYGALVWIGRQSALYDATTNTIPPRPLGAFDWLKTEKVMKFHDVWRLNPKVRFLKTTIDFKPGSDCTFRYPMRRRRTTPSMPLSSPSCLARLGP